MTASSRTLLRGLAGLGVFVYLWWGPVTSQVLGGPRSMWFPTWRMYGTYGLNVCTAEFVAIGRRGGRHVLDRYALLGHTPWYDAPHGIRVLGDARAVARAGKMLCNAVDTPTPDVRATARCARMSGWSEPLREAVNLCTLTQADLQALPARRPRP